MTTTRKPAAKRAPAAPAEKPDPADAAIGRTVRYILNWVAQIAMWALSGWVAVTVYRIYPDQGVGVAVLVDVVLGLLVVFALLWWSR